MITDYQAKYYAYELSRKGGAGVERVGRALFDACVDLNPHQIEASLFSLRSPISKGVLLADEVGLGKTIEAGLSICQYWAEKKRKVLIICPASLRKQWALELQEKFNLPVIVLDAKTSKDLNKLGHENPFDAKQVCIISMHYAGRMAENIKLLPWDLVVIDEAHKLRNAYRQSNKIGQRIRWATDGVKKILMTATPLQNSLTELYGISTLIDENIFGDLPSFRTQYMNTGGDLVDLRSRLQTFCWRTLRSQVLEYVKFTERRLITRPFTPTEKEHELYMGVSEFLKTEGNYALPQGQKHLLILLVRKVLASSPHAVAGTLEIIRDRLIRLKNEFQKKKSALEQLIIDDYIDDDLLDELLEDQEDLETETTEATEDPDSKAIQIDIEKLEIEIKTLNGFIDTARNFGIDSKSVALLTALDVGFSQMHKMGAAQKAVIFTESRRTQAWLKDYLEANGYAGEVLTFNGSNKDDATGNIYTDWLAKNKDTGRSSGSRQVDLRTAIIDHFRDFSSILIATEAGAEGLNLQFASLVINYDLPWNPQRIEQRIGRCHRYGQKHDVVVINFLNERNEADRRVYEILTEKFHLFTGVFGASDDVLGSLESGVDFERKVLEIYQQCRTHEEIALAFKKLQKELDSAIQTRLKETRQKLLEHYDEDVHERLKTNHTDAVETLDRIGKLFWNLSTHILSANASFNEQNHTFKLTKSPCKDSKIGIYKLITKDGDNFGNDFLYRMSHPLGEYVLEQGRKKQCPTSEVVFDITNHLTRISLIEQLKDKEGWLKLDLLSVNSLDTEEYLLFTAIDDKGNNLDQETCEKLMWCQGAISGKAVDSSTIETRLQADADRFVNATLTRNLEENNKHFAEARDQLEKWAEDMVKSVEQELDNIKKQIQEKQRLCRQSTTMQEQKDLQEEIAKLEKKKRKMREKLFNTEDQIAEKRDKLIDALSQRLKQKTKVNTLFTIHWKVV
ncbi:MAG: SNF2-related protein [Candidatus Cloacimonetes bacterium]|jgi:superfamily II DNA/RNA helicase|nr:SNF2-related protein [Candidatus Cloacimonadota bacterium]